MSLRACPPIPLDLALSHHSCPSPQPRHRPLPRAAPPARASGPPPALDLAALLEGGPAAACHVASNYDAILVLGGGLTPDGHLPPWVARRLDAAVTIQRLQGEACVRV